MGRGPRTTVVVASYNQPVALRMVLEGLARQDDREFAVVVADDGSDRDTFDLLEEFRARRVFPLRWVTQQDRRFRKARILNRAILRSEGDLVLFTDGDCVPFADFVRVHREAYRPGGYAAGGYAFLRGARADALDVGGVARGTHEAALTPAVRARLLRVHAANLLYGALRRRNKPKVLGGNLSAARDALEAVNGFDERFDGFSGEDSDLRNRLNNLGAPPTSLWSRAFTVHLPRRIDPRRRIPGASRGRRDPALLRGNRSLVRTPAGLAEHRGRS